MVFANLHRHVYSCSISYINHKVMVTTVVQHADTIDAKRSLDDGAASLGFKERASPNEA